MSQNNEPGQIPIIIVEDLHVMRKAIRRTIEREPGFVIEEFAHGGEAIEFLKKNPVDLVISDMIMPNTDGFELLRYIRSRPIANDMPVIFVTGEATKDDIVHAVDMGATDYVLKPFEPKEFLAKIKSVLARYHNPTERVQMLRTAESWLLLGDLEQAESMFKDLHAMEPKSPRILVGMAQICLQKNDKDRALEFINQSIQSNAMYFPAYTLGANIYLDLGNKRDAIELLLRELSINGKQPDRRLLLADMYASLDDFQRAFEQLRAALQDYPKDEKLLLRMAEHYFFAGDPDKSIHYFLKTRRTHPKSMRALEGVLKVAVHSGKPQKAVYAYTDLLKLNPNQKDIYYIRAKIYEKIGEFTNGLTDIDLFLQSSQESVDGWQLKAKILNKLDKPVEAIDVWKKIVSLSPTADNLGKLALMLLKTNDFLGAAAMYEKAIPLAPDSAKLYFNLACAYENLQSYARALKAYEHFLQLNPGNPDAMEAVTRLQSMGTGSANAQNPGAQMNRVANRVAPVAPSRQRTLERKKPPRAG